MVVLFSAADCLTDRPFVEAPRVPSSRSTASPAAALALIAAFVLALGCTSEGTDPNATTGLPPVASFSQSATQGPPGTMVTFTDTSTGALSRSWSFGPNATPSTSTAASPVVTYATAGTFGVTLSVVGENGTGTVTRAAAVVIADPPTTGFSCAPTGSVSDANLMGVSGMSVTCTDTSVGTTTVLYDYGDGTVTTDPTHVYTISDAGPSQMFTISQTVTGPGGGPVMSPAIDDVTVTVSPLRIVASPTSGPAPVTVSLSINGEAVSSSLNNLPLGIASTLRWQINGSAVGTVMPTNAAMPETLMTQLSTPGNYQVDLVYEHANGQSSARTFGPIVVGFSPAVAVFTPSPSVGSGPLDVTFTDESTGAIDRWIWEFEASGTPGMSVCCVFPAQGAPLASPPGNCPASPPTCSSQNPTQTFANLGRFDVQLTVDGPDAMGTPNAVRNTSGSSLTPESAVVVAILDGSFEGQSTGAPLASPWTGLPSAGMGSADAHTVLRTSPGGADLGMPTDGTAWAVLDGMSTDGTETPATVVNGISQSQILRPQNAPVLEFDYSLLFNEPPGGGNLADYFLATISDGSTTITIPSSNVTAADPYAGTSLRFPDRESLPVRITPTYTGSINLSTAFGGVTDATRFTLAFRTGNGGSDGFRDPRAYVDNVRFVPAETAINPEIFLIDPEMPNTFVSPMLLLEGVPIQFVDGTCRLADSAGGICNMAVMCTAAQVGSGVCSVASSHRWDFATSTLATPPSASGSRLAEPTYTFTESGMFTVELVSRIGDEQGSTTMAFTVLETDITVVTPNPPPFLAGDTLTFDARTPGLAAPPGTTYSWDFGGFGTDPGISGPVMATFPQAGTFVITLDVTVPSGQTSRTTTMVTIN